MNCAHGHEELGLRGIKLLPMYAGFRPDDPALDPLWQYAEKHGLPVLLHTGTTFVTQAPLECTLPRLIEPVALKYPGVKIILAHLGHPYEGECIVTIRKHPNVFADISALHYRPWQLYNSLMLVQEYGVWHKLLFGTDYPFTTVNATIDGLRGLNDMLDGTKLPRLDVDADRGADPSRQPAADRAGVKPVAMSVSESTAGPAASHGHPDRVGWRKRRALPRRSWARSPCHGAASARSRSPPHEINTPRIGWFAARASLRWPHERLRTHAADHPLAGRTLPGTARAFQLARQAGLSESRFHREFVAWTGGDSEGFGAMPHPQPRTGAARGGDRRYSTPRWMRVSPVPADCTICACLWTAATPGEIRRGGEGLEIAGAPRRHRLAAA